MQSLMHSLPDFYRSKYPDACLIWVSASLKCLEIALEPFADPHFTVSRSTLMPTVRNGGLASKDDSLTIPFLSQHALDYRIWQP